MSKNNKTFIYAIIDPRDNLVWYIGKSINPIQREIDHRNSLKSYSASNKKMKKWLKELLDENIKFVFKVFDEASSKQEWQAKERYYIKYFRKLNPNLININCGEIRGEVTLIAEVEEELRKQRLIYAKQIYSEDQLVREFSSIEQMAKSLNLNLEKIEYKLLTKKPLKGFLFSKDKDNFPKWPMNMQDLEEYLGIY